MNIYIFNNKKSLQLYLFNFHNYINSKLNKPQFSQTVGQMFYNKNDFQFDFLAEKVEKIEKKTLLKRFSTWLDQYI